MGGDVGSEDLIMDAVKRDLVRLVNAQDLGDDARVKLILRRMVDTLSQINYDCDSAIALITDMLDNSTKMRTLATLGQLLVFLANDLIDYVEGRG
jgi:hypothetical protein